MDILDGEQGMISNVGIGHDFLIKTAESTIQEAFFGREQSFDSDFICKLGIASRPCAYHCPSSCLPLPPFPRKQLVSSAHPCFPAAKSASFLSFRSSPRARILWGSSLVFSSLRSSILHKSWSANSPSKEKTYPMRIQNLGN